MNRKAGAVRLAGVLGGGWATGFFVEEAVVEALRAGGGEDWVVADDVQAGAGESSVAPKITKEASSDVFMERVSLATRVPRRLGNRK